MKAHTVASESALQFPYLFRSGLIVPCLFCRGI
jgi:hypothetical protein